MRERFGADPAAGLAEMRLAFLAMQQLQEYRGAPDHAAAERAVMDPMPLNADAAARLVASEVSIDVPQTPQF